MARIVVHDYSGHPGQAQLSRALAGRGYEVTHQHCPSYATGKGSLQVQAGDPDTLSFEPCAMEGTFAKYSAVTRIRQEVSYGRRAARAIMGKDPAVAVISNVPLLAHALLARRLARGGVPMVFWHQDIYSEAIGSAARRRVPVVGSLIARLAERLERGIARRSGAVVAISPTFLDKLSDWGVGDRSCVVPNWAPLEELPLCAVDNEWRRAAGLGDHPVVLYSGTLGLKHDPSILAEVAERLRVSHPEARVVVISEGKGRDWLEAWKDKRSGGGGTCGAAGTGAVGADVVDNLVLMDFQPYSDLPAVLASADVLMAVLEPDASRFSVPSKVLTYLCAGRSIVGVLPRDNAVAEILTSHGAGLVVGRGEVAGAVERLLDDDARRESMGWASRSYAEQNFSPETAADRFVEVFALVAPAAFPATPGVSGGRLVVGRETVCDQEISWSDDGSTDHVGSAVMGDDRADNKVTAIGPFPHHVG